MPNTITDLKAHVYDCMAQIEYLQKQIADTNQKIAEQIKADKETQTDKAE